MAISKNHEINQGIEQKRAHLRPDSGPQFGIGSAVLTTSINSTIFGE